MTPAAYVSLQGAEFFITHIWTVPVASVLIVTRLTMLYLNESGKSEEKGEKIMTQATS